MIARPSTRHGKDPDSSRDDPRRSSRYKLARDHPFACADLGSVDLLSMITSHARYFISLTVVVTHIGDEYHEVAFYPMMPDNPE